MTIQELFVRCNQDLLWVIDQIDDKQWEDQLPDGVSIKPTSLADAVRYHAYDDAWVADVLAGKTMEEVGGEHEYILKAEDIKDAYRTCNLDATIAALSCKDVTVMTHLSYGDFSAAEYLLHAVCFRALRIFDISKVIAINTEMSADIIESLFEILVPHIESYREMGVFPPAIEAPEDADVQTKLLALAGRER